MRASLIAAVLCAAGLVIPWAHAQQRDTLRKQILDYKTEAEKGDASAQFNLGNSYYNGHGVPKDYTEAVKWYRKAVEQNDASAQYALASCYDTGRGVEKDYAEAYAYSNLAAKTFEPAASARDTLEKKMAPQQVADAQKRTKELRAQVEGKLKSGDK